MNCRTRDSEGTQHAQIWYEVNGSCCNRFRPVLHAETVSEDRERKISPKFFISMHAIQMHVCTASVSARWHRLGVEGATFFHE